MKRYEKTINGKTVRKGLNEIVIKKNGMVTYNPTEEMVLADGWVEYIVPVRIPTEKGLLKRAKERVLRRISDFDTSKEVDDCIIRKDGVEFSYWKDKYERDSLKDAVRDFIAMGRETYRLDLREYGVSIYIPCEALLTMLSTLEVYATDCYNKTTDHIYNVNNLLTEEEVEVYDYRVGYPEKLTFEL